MEPGCVWASFGLAFITALWVGIDARINRVPTYGDRYDLNTGALCWFLGCVVIWPFAFPAYWIRREEFLQSKAKRALSLEEEIRLLKLEVAHLRQRIDELSERQERVPRHATETAFKAADDVFCDGGRSITHRLDIHPGQGIGPIRHGMRPAEVFAVFNEPQVYEDWMGGNLNDALLFHGLRLHFGECDSRAPLPDSTLNWVVIHQREDAHLFERSMTEWTKAAILEELRARGYTAETPPNGDVEVPGQLSMSFDAEGRLVWVEI